MDRAVIKRERRVSDRGAAIQPASKSTIDSGAPLVDDPAPEGHELNLEDVPLDLVERMARGHWEQARAQVEEASPTATEAAR